jgi:hypothetical protein
MKLLGEHSNGGRSTTLAGLLLKVLAKQDEMVEKLAAYQYGWQRLKGGETRI